MIRSKISQDERLMCHALALAEKGRGFTSPNPVVGACIVKNGKLIADGWHAKFGGPHAEVEAIRKAGKKAQGATLYVTLEPCSTYGKTPPCTDAVIEAKLKRVVIAALDPNPKHAGRAIKILKRAGIQVQTGVLKAQAEKQNEAFNKWIRTARPFVILKMAQSLDGKIATTKGESRWISGVQARDYVQQLRAQSDGILAGQNTVLRDNPSLTVRMNRPVRQPWRIVLDAKGIIPVASNVFQVGGPTVLVCARKNMSRVLKKFSRTNVSVLPVDEKQHKLNLKQVLQKVGELGLAQILVEGGGEVAWSLLDEGLVDKVEWIVAPKMIGGREATTSVEGDGIKRLADAILIQNLEVRKLGADILFEGYLK